MNLEKHKNRLEQLDQLIRLKATGTPRELALKMAISESQLYRLINAMKALGAPISYCKFRKTYLYERKGLFLIGFQSQESRLDHAKGGKKPLFMMKDTFQWSLKRYL